MPLVDGVVGRFRVDLRLARILRAGGLDGGRQRLVLDGHRLGGVAGRGQRVGDDDGDVIADIAHLALGEGRMRSGFHRRAVLGMDHPAANQSADLVLGDILASKDVHVVAAFKLGDVDALDVGVRVRRAHKHGIGLARTADIVGVLAFAGDETLVFLAPYWRADAGCAHGLPPSLLVVRGSLPLSCMSARAAAAYSAAWRRPPAMAAAPARTAATMLW